MCCKENIHNIAFDRQLVSALRRVSDVLIFRLTYSREERIPALLATWQNREDSTSTGLKKRRKKEGWHGKVILEEGRTASETWLQLSVVQWLSNFDDDFVHFLSQWHLKQRGKAERNLRSLPPNSRHSLLLYLNFSSARFSCFHKIKSCPGESSLVDI